MEQQRIAGQVIAIDLDRHMEISESHAKQRAMESLAGRVSKQFPDCAMCKNLELIEEMDHMRFRRKYAVTCKSRPAYPGGTITCPDGTVGRIDEKEKKFMAVAKPTLIWPSDFDEYKAHLSRPGSHDEFVREYMTDPMLAKDIDVMKRMVEEKAKRIAEDEEKLLRRKVMMGEFDTHGVSKIAAGLDSLLKPATRIPSDRASFQPVQRRNKDVPLTSEEEAW